MQNYQGRRSDLKPLPKLPKEFILTSTSVDIQQDPRFKNHAPGEGSQVHSIGDYVGAYSKELQEAVAKVPASNLEKWVQVLEQVLARSAKVFVAGNGGSWALANHLTCDWMKGTSAPGQEFLKVHSLACNGELVSAIANDYGYGHIFSHQLAMLAGSQDIVVLISSSGNSPNIVRAAQWAKDNHIYLIGLTGFEGGELKNLSDLSIHIDAQNYGIVEDAHQILFQSVGQWIAQRR